MTVEYFLDMCKREDMRQHIFTLNSANKYENVIPSSECAMHMGAADKTPELIFLSENKRYAYVLATDGEYYHGLTSEIVPWSARPAETRP